MHATHLYLFFPPPPLLLLLLFLRRLISDIVVNCSKGTKEGRKEGQADKVFVFPLFNFASFFFEFFIEFDLDLDLNLHLYISG